MWRQFCCCCFYREYETSDLQELDYSHHSLSEVPPEVFSHERTLEKLSLASNNIADLPPNLFHCHELRELILYDNELKSLPSAISSLHRLVRLDVSRNGLCEIPESIKACKQLTHLNLSLNPLLRLPDAICQLVNLEEILLNDTQLEFLPASFGRLTKLKSVELRDNLLVGLPKSMGRLGLLQRLDIGGNEMNFVPEAVGSMANLTELWCDSNTIQQIPDFIGHLTKLTCLDASKNRIVYIAQEIGKCSNLVDVSLSNNLFDFPSDGVSKLENVVTLRLDNNRLKRLPAEIGKMSSLHELSCSNNPDLDVLPDSIGLLRNLQVLYADNNKLSELPKNIGSCTSLTILSLANNRLTKVPEEIGRLSNLKMLNLTNNSIRNLPVTVLGLTKLGALWLTERQDKPLVTLNREFDQESNSYVVTCCLLPQLPKPATSTSTPEGMESNRRHRSTRKIRFQHTEEEAVVVEKPVVNGGLSRAPTPYPKEMRMMAKQVSQLRLSKPHSDAQASDEPVYEGDKPEDIPVHINNGNQAGAQPQRLQDSSANSEFPGVNESERCKDKQSLKLSSSLPNFHEPLPKLKASTSTSVIDAEEFPGCDKQRSQPAETESEGLPLEAPVMKLSPPPYEIAAQRAAFLRSSGGAGSGKSGCISSGSSNVAPLPAGSYDGDTNSWNLPRTSQDDHASVVYKRDMSVKANDTVSASKSHGSETRLEHDCRVYLPDKNGNLTSESEYCFDGESSGAIPSMASPLTRLPTLQMASEEAVTRAALSKSKVAKPVPDRHCRIPSLRSSFTKKNPAVNVEPGNVQPHAAGPVEHVPDPNLPSTSLPIPQLMNKGRPPVRESPVGVQIPTRIVPPGRLSNINTQQLPSPFTPDQKQSLRKFPASTTKVVRSGIPTSGFIKPQSPGHVENPAAAHPIHETRRGNGSRIPKFDSPRPVADEMAVAASSDSKPPLLATHDMSGIMEIDGLRNNSRSNIPKASNSVTFESKLPKAKRWIFGTHQNARVVPVEYRKPTLTDVGITLMDFTGDGHREGGVYVTGKDPDVQEINIGDRIVQVDGIDCLQMPAEIVAKVFYNCKENVQVLVSRQ